jgi:hypothetical protein
LLSVRALLGDSTMIRFDAGISWIGTSMGRMASGDSSNSLPVRLHFHTFGQI